MEYISLSWSNIPARSPLKSRGRLMCSGSVNSSCFPCGTRHVTLDANPVISHEWGKDWIVITTNGTSYLFLATLLVIEVKIQECERSCICVLRISICRFCSLVIIYTYRWNLYGMHTGFRYIEDGHILYSWCYSKIIHIFNVVCTTVRYKYMESQMCIICRTIHMCK
jgi:hypothetical protein